MRVGFPARTFMMAEKYWDKLQYKENCWWGVTQQPLYDALKKRNQTKIAFHCEKQAIDKNKKSGNQFFKINPVNNQEL